MSEDLKLENRPDADTKLEIHALYVLAEAFAPLDDATRARVLRWAYSRYIDDIDQLAAAELAEARSV